MSRIPAILSLAALVAFVALVASMLFLPVAAFAQQNAVENGTIANPADRVQLLNPPKPFASTASAPEAVVYCLTDQVQEVWSDGAWDPFTQMLNGLCNNAGQRAQIEGQTHFLDTWELSYFWWYFYNNAGSRVRWLTMLPNDEGTGYEDYRQILSTYDGSERQTSETIEDWDGSQWVPVERTVDEYDGDQQATSTEQEWDGSQWQNVYRERLDDTLDEISYEESWDGSAWQLKLRNQVVSSDADNFVWIISSWDGSQFVDSVRYSQTDEYLRVENWSGTEWIGEVNQLLTYDDNGRIVELVEQGWDGAGWVNDYRARYVFDPDTQFQVEFWLDAWDGTGWVDEHRQLTTATSEDELLSEEEVWQDWNGSEWENLQRYLRNYHAISVANEPTDRAHGFSLSPAYPNPATSVATVRYELGRPGPATITLYDMLGRTVRTVATGSAAAGEHDATIDVTALASGVYYYRLESGDIRLTQPLVVR